MKKFNKYFDHTLLKPAATAADIKKLCDEAAEYDFASVCVNGCRVALAAKYLEASDVKVAAVIGFPLGAGSTESKLYEASHALGDGASELDMVINIGAVKDGNFKYVTDEIMAVSRLCRESSVDTVLKVILETCFLTKNEIVGACRAAMDGGADFVKTSTGFGTRGASLDDIRIMRSAVGEKMKIKASGGIRTLDEAKAFIAAGADRLGCSASCDIIRKILEN